MYISTFVPNQQFFRTLCKMANVFELSSLAKKPEKAVYVPNFVLKRALENGLKKYY